AVVACHLVLWRTPFGFRLRVVGASEGAARYAGIGAARATLSVMMLAGALAGVAGAIEVLGVHYRLIEGFSQGFGFAAVSIALIGGLSPLGVLPAGLFFGFLESGGAGVGARVGGAAAAPPAAPAPASPPASPPACCSPCSSPSRPCGSAPTRW